MSNIYYCINCNSPQGMYKIVIKKDTKNKLNLPVSIDIILCSKCYKKHLELDNETLL